MAVHPHREHRRDHAARAPSSRDASRPSPFFQAKETHCKGPRNGSGPRGEGGGLCLLGDGSARGEQSRWAESWVLGR